ncbi:MAG TPA: ABC transporter ATP-binding protein [Candidatus Mucispirillum faecigallinarum]|uniref:ABC transporter ATP-binding protein n=1 Tax=Candidatus Mucispirillum faecigallinarum TaxID=2838699 RepID=A0A9D2KCK8_9BACT|nr:ABC transporter ATP-binding protein [Candidatus Mucispirillum faecigallinarum]
MVNVENISKAFKDVQALNNVSFNAEEGELFGIIGPDGAGKTTLFRIMTTLTIPDNGSVLINNRSIFNDYLEIRKHIGYMPGRFALYQDLTVEENLKFFASVFNTTIEENYHLVKGIYSHIAPFKNRKAGKLSGGMKQKLALSCALIHKPEVLFLDEPTTGVDPVSRKEFWDMLYDLKNMGITIIVSTPYMDEASRCDRIALIKNGEFIDEDTPANIINNFNKILIAVKADNMRSLLKDIRKCNQINSAFAFGAEIHAVIYEEESIDNIKTQLQNYNHKNIEISRIKPAIEDCYIWSR